MNILSATTLDSLSLRTVLFGLVGLCGVFALPASAVTRAQVHLDLPGAQFVSYGHDRRRSYNRSNRSNRSYSSRNRGYQRNYNLGYNSGFNSRYNSGYSRGDRYLSNNYSGNSCQRVSKRGYWHGRPAVIGGRECIDRQGYAYVVPTSRFLIRYY